MAILLWIFHLDPLLVVVSFFSFFVPFKVFLPINDIHEFVSTYLQVLSLQCFIGKIFLQVPDDQSLLQRNIVPNDYQFKIFKLKNFLAIIVLNKLANYWWNFFAPKLSDQLLFKFLFVFFLPLKRLCQQLKFFWKEGIFPT